MTASERARLARTRDRLGAAQVMQMPLAIRSLLEVAWAELDELCREAPDLPRANGPQPTRVWVDEVVSMPEGIFGGLPKRGGNAIPVSPEEDAAWAERYTGDH